MQGLFRNSSVPAPFVPVLLLPVRRALIPCLRRVFPYRAWTAAAPDSIPGSVNPADSPAPADPADTPALEDSVGNPAPAGSADTPASAGSADSPAPADPADTLASVGSVDSPASAGSADSPAPAASALQPAPPAAWAAAPLPLPRLQPPAAWPPLPPSSSARLRASSAVCCDRRGIRRQDICFGRSRLLCIRSHGLLYNSEPICGGRLRSTYLPPCPSAVFSALSLPLRSWLFPFSPRTPPV